MLPRPGPPWNILVPSLFSNTHFLHGFRNILPRKSSTAKMKAHRRRCCLDLRPPWNILVPSLFSNTHFLHGFRNIVPREIVDRQNESPSATLPTGSLNAPSGKLRFKSWSDLNPKRGARRKLFSRRIFYVTSMRKHPL
jgi:hypothetical protein